MAIKNEILHRLVLVLTWAWLLLIGAWLIYLIVEEFKFDILGDDLLDFLGFVLMGLIGSQLPRVIWFITTGKPHLFPPKG